MLYLIVMNNRVFLLLVTDADWSEDADVSDSGSELSGNDDGGVRSKKKSDCVRGKSLGKNRY